MVTTRPRLLLVRALLALLAFALAFAVLEVGARVWLRGSTPVRMRDGIYLSRLPLVNGRRSWQVLPPLEGTPLPQDKAPGELRIFTFGESSMVGAPWGFEASPATMLHDALAAALPGRKVTVVNMGKTSSFLMDASYYVLAARAYHPDVLVFYQGANDRADLDAEMCMPERSPHLFGAWRWLVAHSQLVYAVRVLGPEQASPVVPFLHPHAHMESKGIDLCPATSFGHWTDLVIAEGKAMGARVVVVSPIRSTLDGLDGDLAGSNRQLPPAQALAQASGLYRLLLSCVLTPGCDAPAIEAAAGLAQASHLDGLVACLRSPLLTVGMCLQSVRLPRPAPIMAARGEMWRASAQRLGATFVDFRRMFTDLQPHGVMGPPLVVDEVHLSLEGYALLAETMARAVDPSATARLPVARYRRDIGDEGALRLGHALGQIGKRQFLVAATLMDGPALANPNSDAALLLGWMRLSLGLASGLSPSREALARTIDLKAMQQRALQASAALQGRAGMARTWKH